MKRIAFIDHQIDNFHANTFARLLGEQADEFKLTAVYSTQQENLETWAAKNQVTPVASIAELADHADCLMVLAPSNPEVHHVLCREAFSLGKTTYVDKTFAPDAATAKEIFAEALRCHVPVSTSSVLRYTEVQEYCRDKGTVLHLETWAASSNFDEYLIHPVEHVVSIMGTEADDIRLEGTDARWKIDLSFPEGRSATIHFYGGTHACPFFTIVRHAERTQPVLIDNKQLFRAGLQGILNFFKDPRSAVAEEETLAIMRIRDAVRGQRMEHSPKEM